MTDQETTGGKKKLTKKKKINKLWKLLKKLSIILYPRR